MKPKKFNRLPQVLIYLALIVVILIAVQMLGTPVRDRVNSVSYSELLDMVEKDELAYVMTTGNNLVAATRDSGISASEFPQRYNVASLLPSTSQFYSDVNAIYAEKLGKDADLIKVSDYSFTVTVTPPATTPWWVEWIPLLVTMLLFGVLWYFMMRQQGGGGKGVMNFGKSRARLSDPSKNKVTFANVAGAQEETEELREIVDFLKDPKKFQDLGARVPKGVLLVGPPGTGKTLLARAVAGEAGVPFFTISGSDFVEMFVGVGASRVRDLFDEAKKRAPAIVFIDEIDAVGRQRGAGLGGGHDEREQTLNQLLVEMDGFAINEGVIVLAATNRKDILDPALLRPGRFDRQITVGYPDVRGREAILRVHAKDKPLADDVDLANIAKRTPYCAGADLANILNEAAILCAREGKEKITARHLNDAIERVQMGPEKKSHIVSEEDNRLVACHEAGHAIVGELLPGCDDVHLVTIMPRGGSGGHTLLLPDKESDFTTRAQLLDFVAMALGGYAAEKLVMGEMSTGASSDLQRATDICRRMVTQYGMSDDMGPIYLGGDHDEVFLARDYGQQSRTYSEDVAARIDAEVQRKMNEGLARATALLIEKRDKLDGLSALLMEKETIDRAEFVAFMNSEAGALEAGE